MAPVMVRPASPGTASLAPGTVSLSQSDTRNQGAPGTRQDGRARDGTSAGNDMDREPCTGDVKPGTRVGAGAVQCIKNTCVYIYTRGY